jgi:transposase InsO family protein
MKIDYPIALLCAVLQVSRSGYHAWAGGRRNRRATRDQQLGARIATAFEQSRQSYGYPRMTIELREHGERVGKARVARLMRAAGLQGRIRRRFRPRTTLSDHQGPIAPNRLAERTAITACNQVWQTDITYLHTDQGWLYLAVVLDAFSCRILGWAFSDTLHCDFVLAAFTMATTLRGGRLPEGMLVHSDRGVQYASKRFRRALARHHALASMSRKGNCYDNAKAEAFFSTLKMEFVYRHRFADRDQARQATFEWIEAFYNRRRRHSAIGNLSPIDFENQLN